MRDSELLTVEEAAVMARRSVPTIWRWARTGRLTTYAVAGRTRVRRADLLRALAPERRRVERGGDPQ